MATREENLKKINDELEKLDDEQLEQVSGGTYGETAADSYFLSPFGLCGKYSPYDIQFDNGTSKAEDVKRGWAKIGVEMEYYGASESFDTFSAGRSNRYFINGVEVTRQEAFYHIITFFGTHGIPR